MSSGGLCFAAHDDHAASKTQQRNNQLQGVKGVPLPVSLCKGVTGLRTRGIRECFRAESVQQPSQSPGQGTARFYYEAYTHSASLLPRL